MGVGKRGQVTFEYLVVIGMVLLLAIPFFDYSFYILGVNSGTAGAVMEAVEVATSLDMIAELGEGNVNTVMVTNDIEISQNGLVTIKFPNGGDISIPSSVTLQTPKLQLKPGKVTINQTKDGIVAVNKPVIKSVSPTNFKDVTIVDVQGENFASDAYAMVKGGKYSQEYVVELETSSTTHLLIDPSKPPLPDGDYQIYILLEKGSVYSDGFPVTYEGIISTAG